MSPLPPWINPWGRVSRVLRVRVRISITITVSISGSSDSLAYRHFNVYWRLCGVIFRHFSTMLHKYSAEKRFLYIGTASGPRPLS